MISYPLYTVPPTPAGFELILDGKSLNISARFIKNDTHLIIVSWDYEAIFPLRALVPLFQGIKNNLQLPSPDFVGVWKWKDVIDGENVGFTRVMCANSDDESGYMIFNLSRRSYILSSSRQQYTFLDRELIEDGLADLFIKLGQESTDAH